MNGTVGTTTTHHPNQRAAADRRPAAVGVRAGEGQRAGAGLGDALASATITDDSRKRQGGTVADAQVVRQCQGRGNAVRSGGGRLDQVAVLPPLVNVKPAPPLAASV